MVVFVDLDDPDEVEHQQHQHGHNTPFDMRELINAHTARSISHPLEQEVESGEEDDAEQEHPNLNALSAVLGNYPFVLQSLITHR
jgi:hypothetical protein